MENQNQPAPAATTPTNASRLSDADIELLDAFRRAKPSADPPRLSNAVHKAVDGLVVAGITREDDEAERKERKAQTTVDEALKDLWKTRGSRYEACWFSNFETTEPEMVKVLQAVRDYARHIRDKIKAGRNILLIGPPGTGKDHLLAVLMRKAVVVGCSVKWTSGARLFARLRDDIEAHAMESATVREFVTPNVLVISDPVWDGQPLTRQQLFKLGEIVDARYNDRRAVWISLNAKDKAEAEATMGVPLVRRLRDEALSLVCDWPSYEKTRGK